MESPSPPAPRLFCRQQSFGQPAARAFLLHVCYTARTGGKAKPVQCFQLEGMSPPWEVWIRRSIIAPRKARPTIFRSSPRPAASAPANTFVPLHILLPLIQLAARNSQA
jgi:hypothetical protein